MTALTQMTRPQKVVATMNQAGLDDPTQYGMIVVAWNQASKTYIYRHNDWQLYYHYHNQNFGYWTARNIKMRLVLEFQRDEPITIMMAMMDQAESDAGDWLLSGLPTTLSDVPEERQSAAQQSAISEV